MSLYLKYRPTKFEDFIGNQQIIESLKTIIYTRKIFRPHSYLFEGDYGTGKTTLARILANMIGNENDQICELDAGSDRGVEAADELKKKFKYRPRQSDHIIYIFDEIQVSSSKYQESLLKILEEPPSYLYFIFCTTNPNKINKGILDRCIKYHLFNYTSRELCKILEKICLLENKNISKKVLLDISKKANGSARNAITLLEEIIDLDLNKIEKYIFQDSEKENELSMIANHLYNVDKWNDVRNILKNTKLNPENIRQYIIKYCMNKLLNNRNIDEKAKIILDHLIIYLFAYDKIIDMNTFIYTYVTCLKELEKYVLE